MKKIVFLFICFGFFHAKSQDSTLTRIKLLKDDSTLLASAGDTSYIFNAWVVTYADSGITGFSMTCKTYYYSTANWVVDKDTSFVWNNVSVDSTNNQEYNICKPNDNMLKVCLGRLDPAIRRKFIFNVTGSNGTVIKEFNF